MNSTNGKRDAFSGDRLNYFNYFTEIEEEFVRRRGKPLLISPMDWALVESWKTVGRPWRVLKRTARQTPRVTVTGLVGPVAAGLARLPRRAMRMARHARYHVAVWIRGEAQQR